MAVTEIPLTTLHFSLLECRTLVGHLRQTLFGSSKFSFRTTIPRNSDMLVFSEYPIPGILLTTAIDRSCQTAWDNEPVNHTYCAISTYSTELLKTI